MDTITDLEMQNTMTGIGAFGVIHRYQSLDYRYKHNNGFMCIGPREFDDFTMTYTDDISSLTGLIIDVAHADSEIVHNMIDYFTRCYPKLKLIVGNVCTESAAAKLMRMGVFGIKVGIGPGSVCQTRIVTGCGVPQVTALRWITSIRDRFYPHIRIIADGGIKSSGDIVKALACGADTVMLGSLLAGTKETPGALVTVDGKEYKEYRGMASSHAQASINVNRAPEGVSKLVPYKGPVYDVIKELKEGVQSGLSYLGCGSVRDLKYKVSRGDISAVRISPAGLFESKPNILL
jgi:IMP dehydrogenase